MVSGQFEVIGIDSKNPKLFGGGGFAVFSTSKHRTGVNLQHQTDLEPHIVPKNYRIGRIGSIDDRRGTPGRK